MILNSFQLAGRTAVVTGCNTGLGQGIALALAQAGADIVGVNQSAPAQTMAQVQALGRKFLDVRKSLSDTAALPGIVQEALTLTGHIDILVNNAGIIRRADAINFSESDWDDVVNLNLKNVFFRGGSKNVRRNSREPNIFYSFFFEDSLLSEISLFPF